MRIREQYSLFGVCSSLDNVLLPPLHVRLSLLESGEWPAERTPQRRERTAVRAAGGETETSRGGQTATAAHTRARTPAPRRCSRPSPRRRTAPTRRCPPSHDGREDRDSSATTEPSSRRTAETDESPTASTHGCNTHRADERKGCQL